MNESRNSEVRLIPRQILSLHPSPPNGLCRRHRPTSRRWLCRDVQRDHSLVGVEVQNIGRSKKGHTTGVTDGTLKRSFPDRKPRIKNFELRLKVKYSERANSGIQYRSRMLLPKGLMWQPDINVTSLRDPETQRNGL